MLSLNPGMRTLPLLQGVTCFSLPGWHASSCNLSWLHQGCAWTPLPLQKEDLETGVQCFTRRGWVRDQCTMYATLFGLPDLHMRTCQTNWCSLLIPLAIKAFDTQWKSRGRWMTPWTAAPCVVPDLQLALHRGSFPVCDIIQIIYVLGPTLDVKGGQNDKQVALYLYWFHLEI